MSESLVSRNLEKINHSLKGKMTLGAIVAEMRQSGFGLLIIFLSLPFLQPIPMAGLSTALGFVIALLGAQMFLKRESVWLPKRLAEHKIDEKTGHQLLMAASKFFKFVETFVRPRYEFLARREAVLGALICISALMLAMPIPIPFSNMSCAVPIVLMALALLEKDGVMACLGALALLFSIAFHAAVFILGVEGLRLIYQKLVDWF